MVSIDIGCGTTCRGELGLDVRDVKEVDIRGDARHLPLKDESVHEIIMVDVIEHFRWADVREVISEVFRVLKPEGVFYMRTPDFDWIANNYDTIPPMRLQRKLYGGYTHPLNDGEGYKANQHHTMFTEAIITDLLEEAGYTRTEVNRDLPAPNHWNFAVYAEK